MVDDSREEHRMMIFANDSDPVQARLIRSEGSQSDHPQYGILERKMHPQSYTVTLYALLKDYGLTPIVRIKPRIRFHRSSYDNLSSSAPLRYGLDDIVHFAELKRSVMLTENTENPQLEQFFGDAPTIENLSSDPALQLVSQRDVFLRQPPFKTKTKVFGEGSDIRGIPIGKFLNALNYPQKTEEIFGSFPRGDEFARDLLEALEPFHHLEFQLGLYSRYERRDCVLARDDVDPHAGYRTTFDPWTVLGYIQPTGSAQQLQILAHERGTRWEHKIIIEQVAPSARQLLSREIQTLRRQNLIGRVPSKSQTGLTLLADYRESQFNLTNDRFVDYDLKIEAPLSTDRFADIEARRHLRRVFDSPGQYQLHPLNREMTEKHLNLAKGRRDGVVYTLDNVNLMQGLAPQKIQDGNLTIIRSPISKKKVIRSAQDLRGRMPSNGFEKCWNETIDEGGYTIINTFTGRCYVVSYGKTETGSVFDGKVTLQEPYYYLSVRYIGITPHQNKAEGQQVADKTTNKMAGDTSAKWREFILLLLGVKRDESAQLLNSAIDTERQVIQEMRQLTSFLKEKRLI